MICMCWKLIPSTLLLCTDKNRLTYISSRANFPAAGNKILSLYQESWVTEGSYYLLQGLSLVNLWSPRRLLSKLLSVSVSAPFIFVGIYPSPHPCPQHSLALPWTLFNLLSISPKPSSQLSLYPLSNPSIPHSISLHSNQPPTFSISLYPIAHWPVITPGIFKLWDSSNSLSPSQLTSVLFSSLS